MTQVSGRVSESASVCLGGALWRRGPQQFFARSLNYLGTGSNFVEPPNHAADYFAGDFEIASWSVEAGVAAWHAATN